MIRTNTRNAELDDFVMIDDQRSPANAPARLYDDETMDDDDPSEREPTESEEMLALLDHMDNSSGEVSSSHSLSPASQSGNLEAVNFAVVETHENVPAHDLVATGNRISGLKNALNVLARAAPMIAISASLALCILIIILQVTIP